jgi:large subunit ribosomal protein L5
MDAPNERAGEDKPRMLVRYEEKVRPTLAKEFGFANPMQIPKLEKITLNIGLGEALKVPKMLEQAFEALGNITGQRPVVTRARKSIAGFKLREGQKIGCMVTLRGARMWEFFDRFITVALPRTRDFRGISRKGFDGRGNYTLGVKELLIFPEVDIDKLEKVPGMNISIQTSAKNDDEGRALLQHLGLPFRQVT